MKRFTRALAALLAALCLAGCGASSAAKNAELAPNAMVGESYASTYAQESDATADAGSGVNLPQQGSRKIIYTAELNLESKDYAGTLTQLRDALSQVDGYLASSSEGGSADTGSRWCQLSVRVPADRYGEFLSTASASASLTSKREYTQDITGAYVDVEARLSALKTQRDRLNQLAEDAETTADLLEIESQLSEVQYQIESYAAQQRTYDDQIDYATVDVYLNEVQVYSPTTDSFPARLATAFLSGWSGFVIGLQGLVIALVYLWPGLLVLAVLVLVILLAAKHARKRRLARAAAAAQAAQPPQASAPQAPQYPQSPQQPR